MTATETFREERRGTRTAVNNRATLPRVASQNPQAWLAGSPYPELDAVPDKALSKQPSRNKLKFEYHSEGITPGRVYVEMHEVDESGTHPLTKEGIAAWAEERVQAKPTLDASGTLTIKSGGQVSGT